VHDWGMEEGGLRGGGDGCGGRPGEAGVGTKAGGEDLNSVGFGGEAVAVERGRQVGLLEGGGVVEQQTLLYDSKTNSVRPQRSKEESHDYRYFPDPDLPPLVLTEEFIAEQQTHLPELPAKKRERFAAQHALSVADADVLTSDRAVADYYEAVVHAGADTKL